MAFSLAASMIGDVLDASEAISESAWEPMDQSEELIDTDIAGMLAHATGAELDAIEAEIDREEERQ